MDHLRRAQVVVVAILLATGCTNSPPPRLSPATQSTTLPAMAPTAGRFPKPSIPKEIRASLDLKLYEWDSNRLPFAVALAQLQARSRLPMEIRWDVLTKANIDPEASITL